MRVILGDEGNFMEWCSCDLECVIFISALGKGVVYILNPGMITR